MTLFLNSSMYENICTKVDCCFKLFTFTSWYLLSKGFFLRSLRQISIQQMWAIHLMQFAGKCFFFFQSPFEANKMFCLANKFVQISSLYTFFLPVMEFTSVMKSSELIYIFPKVSNLDEKSLGKIVLMLFLWKCK